jgi:hypothetical protein
VPQKYKEDPSLGRWVKRQRFRFKNGIMDEEQKRMLMRIGFEFNLLDKVNEAFWNLQFKKMRDYYERHGHCELFWAVDCFTFLFNIPTNTPSVSLLAL